VKDIILKWLTIQRRFSYDSELAAASIATELKVEISFMLRSFGVELQWPTLMIGDNISVDVSTSAPSRVLKKKHNAIAYRRVYEAIAAKVMWFA
jgi:hypothetical protein